MTQEFFSRAFAWDDPEDFREFAALWRGWEPRLELTRPPADALLYEPEGTLYAVNLGEALDLKAARREVRLGLGDMVVVPQAFAVDAGPVVDLLGLCHDGPPPDHFRERFIQVQGFEVIRAFTHGPAGLSLEDARHRLAYAAFDVRGTKGVVDAGRSAHARLLIGLEGEVEVSDGGGTPCSLSNRVVRVAWPGVALRLGGRGSVGVLTVPSGPAHEVRRGLAAAEGPGRLSPEHRRS